MMVTISMKFKNQTPGYHGDFLETVQKNCASNANSALQLQDLDIKKLKQGLKF